ncbi:GTA-gp10 family protein [Pararhodobacter sp.]|uniref:GTA-gp10 family protein n=1 Tax=Pararhodobacter sp. TaxID=2127056 RepID=UPI002AFFF8F7|nr:GTA-gp10 family protein [Pararhodobacter sp.]
MSRDARIDFEWAGGFRAFRLGFDQLVELQEVCGAGPQVVHERLIGGAWGVADISHVLRLGLIGGGLSREAAHALVKEHVEGSPPVQNLVYAQLVLGSGIMGAPDETVGQTGGGEGDADPLPDGKIRVADILGAAAVMGFTPQEVGEMSLWQFLAALDGYAKAHDPKSGQKLKAGEKDDLWEMVRAW